jgi:SAM-dependent methyltransferase
MNELIPKGERYDSTRRAWETIWDGASVEIELETQTYARARETIAHYLPYLPKDGIVLEAGSGLGAAILPLKAQGYQVVGLDYAENALHVSQQYDPGLRLTVGDVHALPFAENSIGAYLSFGVFEHFEAGMVRPLGEAFRVLRPRGVLVLTIPYPNLVHDLVQWRRTQRGESGLADDGFYESTYSRDALIDAVRSVGFVPARVVPTGHSFTLWGLGGAFRAPGYYRTSALAEIVGRMLKIAAPWAFNFTTLVIAHKP